MIRASKCLTYLPRQESVEVEHFLSGKKYVITEGVYELLQYLQLPRNEEEVMNRYETSFGTDEVRRTLSFLNTQQLIVPADKDETHYVVRKNPRVFNFQQYVPGTAASGDVVFIGVPYGNGNTVDQNCKIFPPYVRTYTHKYGLNLGEQSNPSCIDFRFINSNIDFSNLEAGIRAGRFKDYGDIHMIDQESPFHVYDKIYQTVQEVASAKLVPFVMGGDHSISFPAIKAVSEQHEALQIVQFDAHIDTYRSQVLDFYLNEGKAPHHHGNFLSQCLKLDNIRKVTQLGIRSFFNAHAEQGPKVNIVWMDELMNTDNWKSRLQLLPDVPVYITFDIDFYDPSIAPGTGTPVNNGMYYYQTCQLVHELFKDSQIAGVDIVEVNPERDNKGQCTMQLATNTILLLLNHT